MNRYNRFRHRNPKTNGVAEKKPTSRDYGDGSMSIKKLAVALGLTTFKYLQVQKALCRIGMLKYKGRVKPEVTELGERYSREHEEIQNEADIVTWRVWKPEVIELLREPLQWVLDNPGANPLEGTEFQSPNTVGKERPVGSVSHDSTNEYPDGFLPVTGLAGLAGVSSKFAAEMLIKWGYAERVKVGSKETLQPNASDVEKGATSRLFPSSKLSASGEPTYFGIYKIAIADELRDEWNERESKLDALVKQAMAGGAK